MTGRLRLLPWGALGLTMAGLAGNVLLAVFARSLPAQTSDWPTFLVVAGLILTFAVAGLLISLRVGFTRATASNGTGVQNMMDRVASLGGHLVLESQPGKGTTVSGSLPLTAVGVAG